MKNGSKRIMVVGGAVLAVVALTSLVKSHCEIPCGIYDDDAGMKEIAEHIFTIEKSMKQIDYLSKQESPNWNQVTRWVNNKELHANKLNDIVTQYFMTQRIKPADSGDQAAYADYTKKLTLLHQMLVFSMKSKQTTDVAHTAKLRSLLGEFHNAYHSH